MLKFMLSSLPIYYLSCFKCPMNVVRRIEKIQHDFYGMTHLIKQNIIWLSGMLCVFLSGKEEWVFSLLLLSIVLLGKWLWRLGGESGSLWKQICSGQI